MWYLAWVLGVPLACSVAVINAMRYEFKQETNSKASDTLIQ